MLNVISGLLAGGVAAATGSYESISTVTVGSGGAATVSFSSIPSTYKHLQIRATYRTASNNWVSVRPNSDSTYTDYYTHYVEGSGAVAQAAAQQNGNLTGLGLNYTQSASASVFDVSIMDILDYTNTSKNKVSRTLRGCDNNGSGFVGLQSAVWFNTAAITQLDIISASAFQQYSSFALYGIKG